MKGGKGGKGDFKGQKGFEHRNRFQLIDYETIERDGPANEHWNQYVAPYYNEQGVGNSPTIQSNANGLPPSSRQSMRAMQEAQQVGIVQRERQSMRAINNQMVYDK